MKLVLASNNAKKLKELSALMAPLGLDWVNQGVLGIPEAEEPHITFVENALAKARHAAAASGLAALADDSGLCVDALGGAPGVHSARYARLSDAELAELSGLGGEREARRAVQDEANNALLLDAMSGIADRRAAFVCALVAVRSEDDPAPLIAFGRWQGVLRHDREGSGGFGYDPLLVIPALGQTVATLAADVKNRHSHRALAAQQMLALMHEAWHLPVCA
jgi:XTP/dITP diphosphohydrolase